MVDADYEDEHLAGMYDVLNQWGPSDDFYLELAMNARSVLDVGCGTAGLLCRARDEGHAGELVGVDPATGMLAVARRKGRNVELVQAAAETFDLGRRFELITMTGHAFQVLLDDDSTRAALANFHRHLVPGGLLAFETRNPAAREWEGWTFERTRTIVRSPTPAPSGPDAVASGLEAPGVEVPVAGAPPVYEAPVDEASVYEAHAQFTGLREPDLVVFDGGFQRLVDGVPAGEPLGGPSTLRFVDPEHLRALLIEAGFTIEGWFGDWDRREVAPSSREIIVLARAGERAR